jgi:hypothetical protein
VKPGTLFGTFVQYADDAAPVALPEYDTGKAFNPILPASRTSRLRPLPRAPQSPLKNSMKSTAKIKLAPLD